MGAGRAVGCPGAWWGQGALPAGFARATSIPLNLTHNGAADAELLSFILSQLLAKSLFLLYLQGGLDPIFQRGFAWGLARYHT